MPANLANVAIRPFSRGDEEFIYDLATEAFSAYSRNPRRAIRSILAERSTETLVAELDSARVGFVVLQYEQLARDFGPWVRPTAARLNAIAVSRHAQGLKIGRRLLESGEAAARGRSALSLSLATAERNAPARRLFEAGGFVQFAHLERYYEGGQAAVLMYRTLIA
jgi:ribosomal protein S18 acetylase RimI-like enzyme